MKVSKSIKSKTAFLLGKILLFADWSHRHRKIILPVMVVLLVILMYTFIVMTKSMIRNHTFEIVFSGLTGRECRYCKKDTSGMRELVNRQMRENSERFHRPASVPDYFYEIEKSTK